MKIKHLISYTLFLFILFNTARTLAKTNTGNYLSKPTGNYAIGFQDFHWIDTNVCPDPNYSGKNKDDFSRRNKRFCHEMRVRIYYPAAANNKPRAYYYKPLIKSIIKSIYQDLSQVPGVTKKHFFQLNQLKSFSVENPPIVLGKKFPVIFFSPGSGSQVEMYENFITELVSHGYIIIGINSSFISGDIELPSGHIVKFNSDESLNDSIQIPLHDFSFAYKQIHSLNKVNMLFSAMDLQHIGALGQSLGGEIVANTVHNQPDWFKAAVTLDSGIDKLDDTLKKFSIPFMRQISANRKYESSIRMVFDLEKNGFLVTISPDEKNHHYSYHMNFTDYSTIQYLPAEQLALNYFKQQGKKSMFGTGNGWEITNSINVYLLQFFDTYLKGKENLTFKKCQPLASNTFIKCGK
jgi:hypothetical protein